MRKFKLENYIEQLTKQVIHMDQAVCYCPEFRATTMTNQYPSRRLQIARAIMNGELEFSDYAGDINFNSILSRQGERWQNFGENPEDCTDVTMLVREMLLEKGYKLPVEQLCNIGFPSWDLPIDSNSKTAILLDANTSVLQGMEEKFRKYCEKNKLSFVNEAEGTCLAFKFFAHGVIEQGTEILKNVVDKYNAMNVEKVMVLSPQTAYMLRTFVKKLDIKPNFEVVYLIETLPPLKQQERTYVYAGSFNTRYLGNSDVINALIPTENDVQIPTSQEFTPLLEGNGRANKLTIWQKPIGAEYGLIKIDSKITKAIKDDAIRDIKEAKATQIIVFEPTAYKILKDEFKDCKVLYYLEII